MLPLQNACKKKFVPISLVVFALSITPKLLISVPFTLFDPVLAQSSSPSPSFPIPESLPSGASFKVNGSGSMTGINEALRKRFEEKYPNTKIEFSSDGTDKAITALLKRDIDLAAIGRSLTDEEKSQGLVAVPVSREKIAIILGSDNPFNGNLTFQQFAKMFRGEITDWSQVGGSPGAIRFIDHPDSSDTRRSLSNYTIFKKAPFKNGSNAVRLSQDDTATIVQELGKDGISYALADRALKLPNVKVVPMHKTMPDDPRYPYSQPRAYVYNKATSNPAVLAFLGFVTSAPGQEIIAAKQQETAPVGRSTATINVGSSVSSQESTGSAPSPAATAETALVPGGATGVTATQGDEQEFHWWPLLLLLGLPLLGLLWWLLKGKGGSAGTPDSSTTSETFGTDASTVTPGASSGVSEASTKIPANSFETGASTVTPGASSGVSEASTKIPANSFGTGASTVTPGASNGASETSTKIPANSWNNVGVRSAASTNIDQRDAVPDVTPTDSVSVALNSTGIPPASLGLAGIAAGAVTGGALFAHRELRSRISLEPRDLTDVYARWEVPPEDREFARQQRGEHFQLRVYDVTNIDPDIQAAHSVQSFDCNELSQDKQVTVPAGERDYIAEVGYLTREGEWLKLARSNQVQVGILAFGEYSPEQMGQVALAGAAVAGGVAAGTATNTTQQIVDVDGNHIVESISNEQLFGAERSYMTQREGCKIQHLTVHSRNHCFQFSEEQMRRLQETAASQILHPGIYIVRLKSANFIYSSTTNYINQPVVLLWIYGGKVINKKTNVLVAATWSSLNGYDDTLTLEVLETATLCAFFFDSYIDDNNGEVTVSAIRLYSNN